MPRIPRWFVNSGTALRLAVVYVILLLVVLGCERRFIYFPMRSEVMDQLAAEAGWVEWLSPQGERLGWIAAAGEGVSGPPLLMMHGNAGSATWRVNWVRMLRKIGFGEVRVVEYPGYGGRPGSPSEQALIQAGEQALRAWTSELGAPVFLLGESLGSGVAAGVYERAPELVRGIMLAVPYDSVVSVGQGKLPFLPVSWMMKDRFETIPRLRGAKVPVAIVAMSRDEVIPVRHARHLAESLKPEGRVLYIELDEGAHDELPYYTELWGQQVFEFLTGGGHSG